MALAISSSLNMPFHFLPSNSKQTLGFYMQIHMCQNVFAPKRWSSRVLGLVESIQRLALEKVN
jgi:hypothetical protein